MTTHPLHALQQEYGARFGIYAGRSTPISYQLGVIGEHLHTRQQAGLFDVSHMNQFEVRSADAAQALEKLIPRDLIDMPLNHSAYALLTNAEGGVRDDLIITRIEKNLFYVVSNACTTESVNSYMRDQLGERFQPIKDHGLLALQGPRAVDVMATLSTEAAQLPSMGSCSIKLLGCDCRVSRTGYTGELGFELSVPDHCVEQMARDLLKSPELRWCGLGSRDSLRLEAGYCLYGQDLDENTTPVEAGLSWVISRPRREGGTRQGGFPGAERILPQFGLPRKELAGVLTGLRASRMPLPLARTGAKIYLDPEAEEPIGRITSGCFSPTLKVNIALAYVPAVYASDQPLWVKLRKKMIAYQSCALPFYRAV